MSMDAHPTTAARRLDLRQPGRRLGDRILHIKHQADQTRQQLKKVEKANQRILKLLSDRNDWFSAVSHELRTPLNIIVNYADSLHDGIFGDLNEDQKEAVTKILKANEAMMHTVNDLLDLSKIEADAVRIHPVDLEYEHLVLSTVDLMRSLAADKGITMQAFIAENVQGVYADPERTEQVLRNLLYNAIKFTPEGGRIEVLVEAGYPAHTHVHTSVIDTGPGIPKDALKHLFQPYFQVDGTSTRHKGGTGLGLAICKALVERMNGSIQVMNEPSGGACFTFSLPARSR